MPSLKLDMVADPRTPPGAPRKRTARPWILAGPLAGLLLALLALGAPLAAQKKGAGARAPRKPAPQTRLLPPQSPLPTGFPQITLTLLEQYFARHPESAYEAGWPQARGLDLGALGARASLQWRETLARSRAGLERLEVELPRLDRARLGVLLDWLEAQEVLFDAQPRSTRDPASYVEHLLRVLESVRNAGWLSAEERATEQQRLVEQLPAFLHDARLSLIAPVPEWIDLALKQLDELDEHLALLPAPSAPAGRLARPGKTSAAPAPETPRAAVDGFRRWLLDRRTGAGGRAPRLSAGEWKKLVRLVTGTAWEPRELEARCLRDIASLERSPLEARAAERAARFAPEKLAGKAHNASALALLLGQEARLLRTRAGADDVVFALEESARAGTAIARVCPSPEDVLEVRIGLPSHAWPVDQTVTRQEALQGPGPIALGVRHGLAGEALYAMLLRARRTPLAALSFRDVRREALGLYALDWVPRVDWVENPLQAGRESLRAFELQRGYEAARLLAALELHTTGLSLGEAALGFARRTGVDADTARAEVRAAERDPLHGVAYVGLLELRALEERLASRTTARRGLGLTLLISLRHPDLRVADLRADAERFLSRLR